MVSFIALVVLLFLLAAAAMVSDAQQQQLPLANLSNLDEESVELYYCGADLVEALESSSIPLEKDRLLTIQEPQTGVVDNNNNIHFPVSVQDIRHIQRWNGGAPPPPPIRRRLAQVNAPPHSHYEPHFNNNNEEDEDNDGGDDGPSINSLEEDTDTDIDIEPIPFSVSKAETGGGGIDNTTIIIVVVSTSTVTFLLATLLFCWYTRTYGGGQNDEKPLLSLSRSASHKSSSSIKDSGDKSYSDPHKTYSSANSSVSLAFTSDQPPTASLSASGIPPLKPPPGRAESTLKPPPGRTDLSVHPPSANTISTPPRSPAAAPPPAPSLPPPPPPLRAPSAKRPPPPPPPSKGAPPPPPPMKEGPCPPPPPGGGRAPPRPPGGGGFKTHLHAFGPGEADADDSNKAKLKPFFWDKVMATPDQAMVWHQIRAGSFQFNEEMIENLFGYNAAEKNKGNNKKSSTSQESSSHFVQIIDSKKAQNLSILLKALNVTTNEVCDALREGNELPVELIQTLLKMAPTGEEELKLRLYNGDISRLGTAERFLKRLVEIPFAFKRLESLLFMCTLQDEEEIIKESFQTLEAACVQLKKSRLFLKLLEAVLKTGNRMNDGTFRGSAQAFKLDTLLKLSDVKGVDGKTTLVHFVVLEIIRAEGVRAAKTAHKSSSSFKTDDLVEEEATANSCQGDKDEYYRTLGLEVVSRLSSELEDVKKAAILDAEGLSGTVSKFGLALVKAREFLNTELKSLEKEDEDEDINDDEDEFSTTLSNFVQNAEKDVMWMLEEEKRIMALVKNTADYFHGHAGKDEGLRLFIIVRDFLIILDKVCKEVKATPLRPPPKTTPTKDVSSTKTKDVSSSKTLETNDDDVSSPRTTHRTQEADETPKTHSLEAGDSPHKIWETEGSQHETQEAQDLQHETQEVNDLQETKSLDKIQKTDVWQHETHDSNYLPHEIQERKSPYETQQEDDDDDDDDNLEPKAHEDDLRHETVEPDDSQSKMQEDDDDLEPTTHEDDDDDLEPTTHEDDDDDDLEPTSHEDDLGHETLEPDDSQFKMQEDDDDDLEPKTQEDDSRHETLEHDDSQSTMQEDDVSQPKTWETDEMHKTDYLPQEIDDSGTKTEDSQLIPATAIRRVDSCNSS